MAASTSVDLVAGWNGRRVLVTGNTGFKGSWLTLWLTRLGAQVYGLALEPPTEPSLWESIDGWKWCKTLEADLRDHRAVRDAIAYCEPEVVFHLAAVSTIGIGYRDPVRTFEVNVMGLVNLLDSVAASDRVRAIVHVSSDKCYRPGQGTTIHNETDPLGGIEPYSASKACAELVLDGWVHQLAAKGIKVASVRSGNVIGGGDFERSRLVPSCVASLAGGSSTLSLRNPDGIRPWIYVLDALRGYLLVGLHLLRKPMSAVERHRYWNLSGSSRTRVMDLARKILTEWNPSNPVSIKIEPSNLPEVRELLIDSSQAREQLTWECIYTLDEAVRRTVRWYQSFYDATPEGSNALCLCYEEIRRYEAYSQTSAAFARESSGKHS